MPTDGDKANAAHTSRRGWLKAGAALAGAVGGLGAYARWIEPVWIEVVRRDLPVPHLPPAWEGVRVGLVADLHHGPRVPLDYLRAGIDRLAALAPDLVAAVGDFVTRGDGVWSTAAARLFERLSPPMGVFACLGNHDYGVTRPVRRAEAKDMARALPQAGVRLLRNASVRLDREGKPLWVVGLEDTWSGRCRPTRALARVPAGAANLTLCHNPDAADALARAGAGAILAGHTHGGQVQVPLLGPPILPVRHRDRYEGLHRVRGASLYINRGLGWLRKVRFCCRPEITILRLRRAEGTGGVPSGPREGVDEPTCTPPPPPSARPAAPPTPR